jgi:hypothetical protein
MKQLFIYLDRHINMLDIMLKTSWMIIYIHIVGNTMASSTKVLHPSRGSRSHLHLRLDARACNLLKELPSSVASRINFNFVISFYSTTRWRGNSSSRNIQFEIFFFLNQLQIWYSYVWHENYLIVSQCHGVTKLRKGLGFYYCSIYFQQKKVSVFSVGLLEISSCYNGWICSSLLFLYDLLNRNK